VQGLRAGNQFSIVAYNSNIGFWRKQLVEANTANKADAVNWIKRLIAEEQTATYDALEAAFYFNAESLYLLTDGDPSTGKIIDKAQIVDAITRQNRARRESIYTIGIAPGPEGAEFDQFLGTLAKQNFGLYKRVDR
ncbi:MAG TPA: hypothetical protein VG713_07365, partial [Pirellulales bacterium]|nr:hypothetical protein [Pirellulales bacterium]